MSAYYNEYDPKAAAWLRELIKAGLIAPGEVDERSIVDVKADDIRGFTQSHFFAGIGGWSYALRLAGWPDDRPCWTGSPPCQPFSNAGKQKAQADARHLWPAFFNLISECKPANIFGEQVEAAIRTGWLDDLQDDLEAEGYATGKIVLPACSIGGYHIRQRIWFVAEWLGDAKHSRLEGHARHGNRGDEPGRLDQVEARSTTASVGDGWLPVKYADECPRCDCCDEPWCEECGEHYADCSCIGPTEDGVEYSECGRFGRRLADSESSECQFTGRTRPRRKGLANDYCDSRTDAPETFWANPDWLFCRDGKWRPVESEVQRVVDGLSDELVRSCNIRSASYPLAKGQEARVMRLRGYGNAIVPAVAAEVIKAYKEART
jgi:DNA (cytosine-5)-methyltransferase 1